MSEKKEKENGERTERVLEETMAEIFFKFDENYILHIQETPRRNSKVSQQYIS